MQIYKSLSHAGQTLDAWEKLWHKSPKWFDYLKQLERLNPCEQFYMGNQKGFLLGYHLKLNLLNFTRIFSWSISCRMVGFPLSVSEKGYFGDSSLITTWIKSFKGMTVVLNGCDDLDLPKGMTLSSYKLQLGYKTFDDYIKHMRSPYRYRINKAVKLGKNLSVMPLTSNHDFDQSLYKLYLEVFEASQDKLECLSIDFFRQIPSEIYVFRAKGSHDPLGFVQLLREGDELLFMFGGFKRDKNRQYDLYMNMLLFIVREGIKSGAATIEFGQTAEETKSKLGCKVVKKYLYVYHSNSLINACLKKIVPCFSYKPYEVNHRVFKS